GQPFSIGLLVTGGDFGNGEPMPVFVQVDTLKAHRVLMQPNKTQGILEAAVRYDAAKHRTLVDQLKQGSQVRIWTWNQNGTGVMVPLTGSAKAITRAMAVCGASAKQAAVRPEGSPGMLSAAAVRSQIIGKNLSFAGGEAEMILLSNGRFEGRMGPRANNGRYRLRSDGRVCWNNGFVSGCFQFYRKNGGINVRRADAKSKADLGPVAVSN
ncbi:MAG: hypothetical protein AAGM04_04280, partial [Pseudomonadota bacterium]